jgi:hypothetical protein
VQEPKVTLPRLFRPRAPQLVRPEENTAELPQKTCPRCPSCAPTCPRTRAARCASSQTEDTLKINLAEIRTNGKRTLLIADMVDPSSCMPGRFTA